MAASSAALEIIFSADLSPTEHFLLESFIQNAIDPELAAQYLLSRIQRGSVETSLRSFKQGWRRLTSTLKTVDPVPAYLDKLVRQRDGPLGCMTKPQPRKGPWIPVVPIESAYIIPPSLIQCLASNEFTLHKSYPERQLGIYYGDGTDIDRISGIFTLTTPNPALKLPDGFLIKVHCRLAVALHLFYIEYKAAIGWPKPEKQCIPRIIKQCFYYFSQSIPLWIRMRFYFLLWRIGKKIYGSPDVEWVQRLPFDLMMKTCINSAQGEPNALKLVEKYTNVPAPRFVDAGEYKGETYLIMTRLPGQELGDVEHLMSYAERDRFADDLANCISQLRTIPNNTGYLLANAVGGHVVDHHIPETKAGPFHNEVDFNNHLTSHLECTPDKVLSKHGLVMREDHQFFFTHADMSPRNLLVENGRLSGIVDWECAGYWPEYWECVKAKAQARRGRVSESIFNRVFGLTYANEWEIHLKLWRVTPFGI